MKKLILFAQFLCLILPSVNHVDFCNHNIGWNFQSGNAASNFNKEYFISRLPLESFQFIKTIESENTEIYEANLSNVVSKSVKLIEVKLIRDDEIFKVEIIYLNFENQEIIQDKKEIEEELFYKIANKAFLLDENTFQLIQDQHNVRDNYLGIIKRKSYNSPTDYISSNYAYMCSLTSVSNYYDAFDFESSDDEDIFDIVPAEVFRNLGSSYFSGKEYGFYIDVKSKENTQILTTNGRLMLFDIEAKYPIADEPEHGHIYYTIKNPITYNFNYCYSNQEDSITFTSKVENLFLRDFAFITHMENNVDLNYDDIGYDMTKDAGEIISSIGSYYSGRGPLVWPENDLPTQEDSIRLEIELQSFVLGFIPFFNIIGSILGGISLAWSFADYIQGIISYEAEGVYDELSYEEQNVQNFYYNSEAQIANHSCLIKSAYLKTSATNEDFFSPLIGEGNYIQSKTSLGHNTQTPLNSSSNDTRLLLGFECDVVEDHTTSTNIDIRKVDSIKILTDFGTFHGTKKYFNLDNIFEINETSTLRPSETARFIINADKRVGRYDGILTGNNITLKISRYYGTNVANYGHEVDMINLTNTISNTTSFVVNFKYGQNYDYLVEVKSNNSITQAATFKISPSIKAEYSYNGIDDYGDSAVVNFSQTAEPDNLSFASYAFNLQITSLNFGALYAPVVEFNLKTDIITRASFYNSNNQIILHDDNVSNIYKTYDLYNDLCLNTNIVISAKTNLLGTVSGSFYVHISKSPNGGFINPPIIINPGIIEVG